MGQIVLSPIQVVLEMFETDMNYELLMETYIESLKVQYGSKHVVFWPEFSKTNERSNSD